MVIEAYYVNIDDMTFCFPNGSPFISLSYNVISTLSTLSHRTGDKWTLSLVSDLGGNDFTFSMFCMVQDT